MYNITFNNKIKQLNKNGKINRKWILKYIYIFDLINLLYFWMEK